MSWYASKTFYFFFIEYKHKVCFFLPTYAYNLPKRGDDEETICSAIIFFKSKLNQNLTDHKEVISFSLYLIALLAKYNLIGKDMRI